MRYPGLDAVRAYGKQLKRQKRMSMVVNAGQKAWQLRKNVIDYTHSKQAVAELQALPSHLHLEQLADTILHGLNGFLRPIQDRSELVTLVTRVKALEPSTVLEIGTAKGGTLYLLSKAAKTNATIISCDLPGGLYGGGYPAWKGDIFRKLISAPQQLHLIRGNSHDAETRRKVVTAIGSAKVDLLFIDGDHSYAGVKHDFMFYRDLVRPGGLIGLHDILPNRFDPDIDVARFWDEVKMEYNTEEIVADRNQGRFGIGLVKVPDRW